MMLVLLSLFACETEPQAPAGERPITIESLEAVVEAQAARLEALEAKTRRLEELEARVEASEPVLAEAADLLALVSADPEAGAVVVEGANLYVRSGSGATDGEVNGLGNVVLGYGEGLDVQGSHNLLNGTGHRVSSYGGVVFGQDHEVTRKYASVLGGAGNTAVVRYAVVVGGSDNTASGDGAVVVGGQENDASGHRAVVGGGLLNTAEGFWSVVDGGRGQIAQEEAGVAP